MRVTAVANSRKSKRTETQVLLAQYFTPSPIAEYMSDMFTKHSGDIRVLDPGAGEGILGLTLLNKLKTKDTSATFVELDKPTFETLENTVAQLERKPSIELVNNDFIDAAFALEDQGKTFTHVIMNPPYFKLRVDSPSSRRLRSQGIQITNIYAAFVWLAARLLEDKGQLVAIIPRSFCNGPYFQSFREYLAGNFSIDGIHIFSSRNKAFSKDSVLQENIILHLSKSKQRSTVKISYSTDQSFSDIAERHVPVESVVAPDDRSKTIHIPSLNQSLSLSDYLSGKLQDLNLKASTGPIVDFRLKDNISDKSSKGAVPLLYPAHMSGHDIDWPLTAFNKVGQYYEPASTAANTLPLEGMEQKISDRNTLPLDGCYVVVRRFSSKEEKRRIFASVVKPEKFKPNAITFENHLNYFHNNKHGFDKDLAYGLCAYLNSSVLDEHFRKVSGHTQVNVSDLKAMPFPNKEQLEKLGKAMQSIDGLIDDIVTRELLGATK